MSRERRFEEDHTNPGGTVRVNGEKKHWGAIIVGVKELKKTPRSMEIKIGKCSKKGEEKRKW